MIWLAFTFGLLSSAHCLAMCGPLQAVVMGQWLSSKSQYKWLTYHLGRLITYSILGLMAAFLGNAIGIPHLQSEFTIAAGLILLSGYFGMKLLKWDKKIFAQVMPILHQLKPKGKKGVWFYYSSGALNGLLPCGMVYAALLPAASADELYNGAVYMLFFGLGTFPLLFVFNLFSNALMLRFGAHFQRLIPISVVLIALLLVLRGMQLDIPYISPPEQISSASAEGCY